MNEQLEQPTSNSQQPVVPSKRIALIVGLIALVALLAAAVAYLLLRQPVVAPASNTAELPSSNNTSAGQTYQNSQYGFEIKYPSDYQVAALPALTDSWKNRGLEYLANLKHTQVDASIQIFIQGQFDLNRIMQEYAPTGLQDILPTSKIIGQNTFYYYGPGGGGVAYPDQYFYNLNGKLLVISFDGPYENEKTPSAAAKQVEKELLETFKLIN